MPRQIRCQSAKTIRITRKKVVSMNHQPTDNNVQLYQFNQEHQISLSHKKTPFNHSTTLDTSSEKQTSRSKSKFLIRVNDKKKTKEQLAFQWKVNLGQKSTKELARKQEMKDKKHKMLIFQNQQYSISNKNIVQNALQIPFQEDMLANIDKNMLHVPLSSRKRKRSASPTVQLVLLNKRPLTDFIIKQNANERVYLHGYWKSENKFVSLIPLENNQKVSFKHNNILEIYAEVTIDQKRYVVSDEYQNCSLQNLLQQFGRFDQLLAKRYLKQIALGLQHMHYYHRGHNRISTKTILYKKDGKLFINAVKSTSFVLFKQQLASYTQLHNFAPQFLLTKGLTKSLKNDVWALGCLAILMLTRQPLSRSSFHPYNFDKYRCPKEEQMIDNMRQRHKNHFSAQAKKQINYCFNLSSPARDFISACLEIMAQNRPSIQTLLQHQFLQGV